MAKYLVVTFDLELSREIDPVTKEEKENIVVGPLGWQGVTVEPDEPYHGSSYFDSTTAAYPGGTKFVHKYTYHIGLGNEQMEDALRKNGQTLDYALNFADCEKSHRACCRLLGGYMIEMIKPFIEACNGVLADEGKFDLDSFEKKPDVKNQIVVSVDTIYLKITGSKAGEAEKSFECEMPFGWFLINTFMTGALLNECRLKLELDEPKKPEEASDGLSEIDTSDMTMEDDEDVMMEEMSEAALDNAQE